MIWYPQRPPSENTSATFPSNLSPFQAIAEAWKRESKESQEKWRKIDANIKKRYNEPVRTSNDKTRRQKAKM